MKAIENYIKALKNFKEIGIDIDVAITLAETILPIVIQKEFSQIEISDEDIEKSISYDSKDPYVEGYIEGAKWYREQLKKYKVV